MTVRPKFIIEAKANKGNQRDYRLIWSTESKTYRMTKYRMTKI